MIRHADKPLLRLSTLVRMFLWVWVLLHVIFYLSSSILFFLNTCSWYFLSYLHVQFYLLINVWLITSFTFVLTLWEHWFVSSHREWWSGKIKTFLHPLYGFVCLLRKVRFSSCFMNVNLFSVEIVRTYVLHIFIHGKYLRLHLIEPIKFTRVSML